MPNEKLLKIIQEFSPQLSKIRRELHQIPELGTEEIKTSALIKNYLSAWDIPFLPIAETGIVAIIVGQEQGAGKVVALRADMDALPLSEDSNRSYHSCHSGKMHACGHDAHMAILLGCAYTFKMMEKHFSGCVKLLFQPAEETVGGAKRMIKEGCLENPHVNYVTGLHVAPGLETGQIEVKSGKMYASSDEIHITLLGETCHGAYPDTGIDAIAMAGTLISSLQSFVSRKVSPLDQAVLTFGSIHGGTAHNIITDCVKLTGTLRTTDQDTREVAVKYMTEQVTHIAKAYGGTGTVAILPGYDALINPKHMVDLLIETAQKIISPNQIHWKEYPGMGVEDFSYFLNDVPGVFYHLGSGNQKQGITAPLHSKDFDIDESCLILGVHLQAQFTFDLLRKS